MEALDVEAHRTSAADRTGTVIASLPGAGVGPTALRRGPRVRGRGSSSAHALASARRRVVRSIKRAADDGGPAVSSPLFPNGLTPIIRPVGQTQAAELRALEGRIAAASRWEGGAAQLARLTPVREAYETALQNRQDGMIAAGNQRALRDAAKEDFLTTFAEVAASIQQLFPRDRRRQDVFFDDVHPRRTVSAGDDPVTDEDDPAPDDE